VVLASTPGFAEAAAAAATVPSLPLTAVLASAPAAGVFDAGRDTSSAIYNSGSPTLLRRSIDRPANPEMACVGPTMIAAAQRIYTIVTTDRLCRHTHDC
jgi:hypothetical protein